MTDAELRALDAEIHRKVMGLECVEHDGYDLNTSQPLAVHGGKEWPHEIPHYSADIAAAFAVME